MSIRIESAVLILLLVAMSFVFQIELKIFANEIAPAFGAGGSSMGERIAFLTRAALAWRPLVIIALAGGLFLVWLLTLTRLELSVALPLASIALVVNAIGAGLLLGEALSTTRIAGVVIVAIGLALVLRS
jgi:drug/metabolite transporter (DMT)-like permease